MSRSLMSKSRSEQASIRTLWGSLVEPVHGELFVQEVGRFHLCHGIEFQGPVEVTPVIRSRVVEP